MTISSPNRYLTSAISGAVLYNSRRLARRSASLGIAIQLISDLIAGEFSSMESYAGAAVTTALIAKYIKNPSGIINLACVGLGTVATQLLEMIGGVQELSVNKIKEETVASIIIAFAAGQLGKINRLKEILGEDEWSAILDGLRRRLSSCVKEIRRRISSCMEG